MEIKEEKQDENVAENGNKKKKITINKPPKRVNYTFLFSCMGALVAALIVALIYYLAVTPWTASASIAAGVFLLPAAAIMAPSTLFALLLVAAVSLSLTLLIFSAILVDTIIENQKDNLALSEHETVKNNRYEFFATNNDSHMQYKPTDQNNEIYQIYDAVPCGVTK